MQARRRAQEMKEQNFPAPHVTATDYPTGARLIAGAREKSIGKIRFHLTYVFEEEKMVEGVSGKGFV